MRPTRPLAKVYQCCAVTDGRISIRRCDEQDDEMGKCRGKRFLLFLPAPAVAVPYRAASRGRAKKPRPGKEEPDAIMMQDEIKRSGRMLSPAEIGEGQEGRRGQGGHAEARLRVRDAGRAFIAFGALYFCVFLGDLPCRSLRCSARWADSASTSGWCSCCAAARSCSPATCFWCARESVGPHRRKPCWVTGCSCGSATSPARSSRSRSSTLRTSPP